MIIFKCNMDSAWDVNGIQILCSTTNENWDYELHGQYGQNLDLLRICIRTIFVNPDKAYKLKFGECVVIPRNYDEVNGGIIDVHNLKVEKHVSYAHNEVVSFCLYGMKPMYFKGALKNIEQYTKTYPNKKCYVYIRNFDVSENMINELEEAGAIVKHCVNMPDWYMMFTRFFPFENPNNKFFLSRDTDCRLIHREAKAIEQWLESDKKFHIIRDHPWHNTLILGGMWGARNMNVEKLRLIIMQWCLMYIKKNENKDKGPDQYFLTNLYKLVKDEVFAQDEFFSYEDLCEIIDAPRNNKEYIGEAYDENDEVLDMKLRDLIEDI